MRVDYYVGEFINGKIILGIQWYHMHLEESRTLHAFEYLVSRVIIEYVTW